MNFRVIGKIGFLLVLIGFFLPIATFSDSWIENLIVSHPNIKENLLENHPAQENIFIPHKMNCFRFAEACIMLFVSSTLYMGGLFSLLFLTSIAGILTGIVLYQKSNVPFFLDWLIIFISLICLCVSSLFFIINPTIVVHFGFYIIFGGVIISLIAQVISTVKKEYVLT